MQKQMYTLDTITYANVINYDLFADPIPFPSDCIDVMKLYTLFARSLRMSKLTPSILFNPLL